MRNINLKVIPTFKHDDQIRMWRTIGFIGKETNGIVLDIGNENPVGNFMARYYKVQKDNTNFDLDFPKFSDFVGKKYDNIWCFENIEHLMNSLLFLKSLRLVCKKDTKIYLTYPLRPRLFWAITHFHEYDKKRFRFMLEQAKYEVIRYKQHIHWRPDWWFYLSGIRPFFRLTVGRCKQQFYELRIK